ncbi:hypothetical protein IW01_01590 [Pectobacterium brasiliense]|uniref:class I SAM-dependent methyltransferase n=1 Tax=Pectobacterium brasiliense TaxID=180957 RepID=UPI0004E68407|nr:class I SAM-dependent methyltransferase [Pectobacterium brasiliense]KFF72889.1 hypothetical protein IW01_01590 [Pectobacterium brasiliense]
MNHIRPYQVLSIEDDYDEAFNFFMPPPSPNGVTSVFESILILKLMRCIDPLRIFEFGTFKGLTTRLLLENLKPVNNVEKRIYTLDLPDIGDITFQGNDKRVAVEAIGYERKYLSSARSAWVEQILIDSKDLDASCYEDKFQFIFIDANHELSYAKKDTENAFRMLAKDVPACIIWHDYQHPTFPELTDYLDDLSQQKQLYHIENTMLVCYLQNITVAPKRTA